MFPEAATRSHKLMMPHFTQLPNCYVIIENVPCYRCKQCGEVYYKASVLEKIDDLLEKLEHIASKIFIMDYSQAA